MKPSLIRLLIPALLSARILAATPATATAQIGAIVQAREQRCNLLRDELRAQDARIEARIDGIVTALQSITDSKDSRTKITRLKETTIKGLKQNLEYFRQKRSVLVEEMRRPTVRLTDEQKRRGIEVFDARMEKRIAQMLALQKSFPTHRDYARYSTHDGGYWGTTYGVNEDYRQNQRLTTHTNAQRKELEADLRRNIERLDQQNRTLRAQGASASETMKNDVLIAERRRQIADLLLPTTPPTREVGKREAADLDAALRKASEELRREFTTLFGRYHTLIAELTALNTARDALAAAQH